MAIETTTVARTLSPAWHWYMPVARRQWWMRYPGITIDDLEKSANACGPAYLGAFVGSVVVPFATARILRLRFAAEIIFRCGKTWGSPSAWTVGADHEFGRTFLESNARRV